MSTRPGLIKAGSNLVDRVRERTFHFQDEVKKGSVIGSTPQWAQGFIENSTWGGDNNTERDTYILSSGNFYTVVLKPLCACGSTVASTTCNCHGLGETSQV